MAGNLFQHHQQFHFIVLGKKKRERVREKVERRERRRHRGTDGNAGRTGSDRIPSERQSFIYSISTKFYLLSFQNNSCTLQLSQFGAPRGRGFTRVGGGSSQIWSFRGKVGSIGACVLLLLLVQEWEGM